MWYVLYNIGLVVAAPIIVAILLAKKRCRGGLLQRLGFLPHDVPFREAPEHPGVHDLLWVHAASLGEVIAAVPLIRALRARYPGYRVIVSTVTETGREAVQQRLSDLAEQDHSFHIPA